MPGSTWMQRKKYERFGDECIQRNVKKQGGQMIWGCFLYYRVETLNFFNVTAKTNYF